MTLLTSGIPDWKTTKVIGCYKTHDYDCYILGLR